MALEINGLPDRLDLVGRGTPSLAVEAGIPLVVSTDAHSITGLGNMELAVAMARRAGATRSDVLNTASVPPAGRDSDGSRSQSTLLGADNARQPDITSDRFFHLEL